MHIQAIQNSELIQYPSKFASFTSFLIEGVLLSTLLLDTFPNFFCGLSRGDSPWSFIFRAYFLFFLNILQSTSSTLCTSGIDSSGTNQLNVGVILFDSSLRRLLVCVGQSISGALVFSMSLSSRYVQSEPTTC